MLELLNTLDRGLFRFFNGTLGNPVFDSVMPVLTDLNQSWYGRTIMAAAWLLLLLKGGRQGRAAALLLIPMIVLTDQLSSSLVKKWVMRPRPCHVIDGLPVVDGVRLLVGCGGGYAFPSSHAVNNFAAATLLAYHLPRWSGYFFGWAALVAFSRISVGVHYPSDVLGGALLGLGAAWLFLSGWKRVYRRYPALDPFSGNTGDGRNTEGRA